ncbi:serine hydrolase domain-containing protein [Maritalea porphyrae]|uniref:serine hydrolase domain-containing protein n=1 Tax=Maritalea porphyrae TaxID=880732 RepID=UPI0022AFDAF8|nr:serine hydrolase [Maritalea porphyrae]
MPVSTAIQSGRIPGGVLGVITKQGERAILSEGMAQSEPSSRRMMDDTWFDLASLTKVIFTTPKILSLALDGRIDLDAPLTTILPDLRQYSTDAWERKVTFRECLGHQTPFPAVEPIYTYGRDPDLLRSFILQREWRHGPSVYSDINFILLGFALERLLGCNIRKIELPEGFAFSAPSDKSAATENCTWRHKMMCGEVHDDNCYALDGAGHAGLFGTANSVLNFATDLLNNSGSPLVTLMRTPLSKTRAHGFEIRYAGWSGGGACSSSTIGHTGFTGTGLWLDFDSGISWTLLTNRIHPTRHFDSGIVQLRQAVGEIVAGS